MVRPRDTAPDAFDRQIAAFRAMGPAERVQLAATMSDEVRRLVEDGIRYRHPGATHDDVRAELEEVFLGPELAAAIRAARPTVAR